MSTITINPHDLFHGEENLLQTPQEGTGYCPLQVGEIVGEDFQIVRKLGWGGSSSVWLAKDTSQDFECYAAVKVMTANSTWGILSDEPHEKCYEFEVFDKLTSPECEGHPSLQYCVEFWRSFYIRSVHGGHYCMALRPYCATLRQLQCSLHPRHFPLDIVKRVVRQALSGLALIHQLGFVHGVDVQSHNLMIDFDPDDYIKPLSERIGRYIRANPVETPYAVPSGGEYSVPPIVVKSQPLGNLGAEQRLNKLRVHVADYGSAISIDQTSCGKPLETPLPSRAPETVLGQPFSVPVDIWAVGCLLFQLDRAHSQSERNQAHLSQMMHYFGPFPSCTMSGDLQRNLALDDQDIGATAAFMHRCFVFDPSQRATASDLLTDNWFQS
ncbi:kinase-like protein [Lentinus tigrinus ALCF2SS1-7]|uniref:Kinase-like protein n=1 Tax=Lentinus tigrinus ALCF2SS1-6 TaxID=1328759 RepID=A0A5C2RUW9_9APHY|nr:kinase-like protein [Lentinus tigrinus ALCF2SS1-6]RPD70638.1 kinase-like protein [Lentinus tigrinus ALCF2SS1-7]